MSPAFLCVITVITTGSVSFLKKLCVADFQLFTACGRRQILGKCSPAYGVWWQSPSYLTGGDRLLEKQTSRPCVLLSDDSVGPSKWGKPWWGICSGTNKPSGKGSTACSDPAPPKASQTLMRKRFLQHLLIPVSFGSAARLSGQPS